MSVRERDESWCVESHHCRNCGKTIMIVALCAHLDDGTAEALEDGEPICQTCKDDARMIWN